MSSKGAIAAENESFIIRGGRDDRLYDVTYSNMRQGGDDWGKHPKGTDVNNDGRRSRAPKSRKPTFYHLPPGGMRLYIDDWD